MEAGTSRKVSIFGQHCEAGLSSSIPRDDEVRARDGLPNAVTVFVIILLSFQLFSPPPRHAVEKSASKDLYRMQRSQLTSKCDKSITHWSKNPAELTHKHVWGARDSRLQANCKSITSNSNCIRTVHCNPISSISLMNR